jgi:hypothetical protein
MEITAVVIAITATRRMRMKKTKFSKSKCKTCIYHGKITGIASGTIYCNYASTTDHTCLKRGEHGEIIDIRGDDRYDCKMYKEGKRIPEEADWKEHNRLWKGENN